MPVQLWSPLLTTLLLVLALTPLSLLAMNSRARWPLYRFLLWPGLVVHEMSHALMAKIWGAKIKEIALFEKNGGYVTYSAPRFPLVADFFIGIAPIPGGLIILALLSWALLGTETLQATLQITETPFALEKWKNFFNSINWLDWRPWLLITIFANAGVALAPSWQDISNGKWAWIFLFLIALMSLWFPFLTDHVWLERINGVLMLTAWAFGCTALMWWILDRIFPNRT